MHERVSPTHFWNFAKLHDAAAVTFVALAIAAVVLTPQPIPMLGRAAHLLSIVAACAVCFSAFGRPFLAYIGLTAAMFAVGAATGLRVGYEAFLCVMFLAAGKEASTNFRHPTADMLSALVIASAAVMLLQILGVGEWTQAMTTHGQMASGISVSKVPSPTFLVPVEDLAANFLQGRPAGLLHSNQFATLVVLLTLSLTVTSRGRFVVDPAVCVALVLLMSKAGFLAAGVMLTVLFFFGGSSVRRRALIYAGLIAVALTAYALLFPGLFQIYLVHSQTIWMSIATRVVNFASVTLGWDAATVAKALKEIGLSSGLSKPTDFTGYAVEAAASSADTAPTAISTIAAYLPVFMGISAVIALAASTSAVVRKEMGRWAGGFGPQQIAPLVVLVIFSLSANFLSAPIFWLMLGFCLPRATKQN